tara:strand:- start:4518 stop:4931 length:414 start_codon:yes stop_codon:yes gene_type:complete
MPRITNWPAALDQYIDRSKYIPFKWGENDCIMFACAGINAITGKNPSAPWLGNYTTALGAARIFKQYGGFEDMIATIASEHGYNERPVALAQRGDLMLHDNKWPSAGICVGRLSAFVSRDSLLFVKTADCRRVWMIN